MACEGTGACTGRRMDVWDVFQGVLKGVGTIRDEDCVGIREIWGEPGWIDRGELRQLT